MKRWVVIDELGKDVVRSGYDLMEILSEFFWKG
jgi:hypothetical protein